MKRVLRILAGLAVLAGIGAVAVSFFFGSLRVDREAAAYLDALEACAPLEQRAWVPLMPGTVGRSVVGMADGACVVTMEAPGAGRIRCALGAEGRALMAAFVRDGAETVTFLGGQRASLRYSSENPDPMTRLLNGPDCAMEE